MKYGQCDWCQEEGLLTTVVNHDPTLSHAFDYVCSVCAALECAEHVDEVFTLYDLVTDFQQCVSMTALLDEQCA